MFFNARWLDPVLGRFAQADTIIPEASQGTQAWDRYAFVNNSPLNFVDPTGHDWEEIIFNRTGAVPRSRWEPLPEPRDIPTGVNFPAKPEEFTGTQEEYEIAIKTKTLVYYEKYREWLIKNGYGHYLDGQGRIHDHVLITLVIYTELAIMKRLDPLAYEAGLSAMSYQFASNSYTFSGPPICGKSCPDLEAQLVWLQAFEGMRSEERFQDLANGDAWLPYVVDASRIMSGRFGDYYSWGNGGGGRLCSVYFSFCVR